MVLLSIFNLMLSRITGQEDIIVGTSTLGREQAGLMNIIGMFVHTLVLRNRPSSGKSFREFLTEVKERSAEAFENQDYPFESLVETLGIKRDPSRNPLFDVMFDLHLVDIPDFETGEFRVEVLEHEHRTAKFDLIFIVLEFKEHLAFSIEYCTRLFKEATVKRFLDTFRGTAAAVLEFRDTPLEDFWIPHGLVIAKKQMVSMELDF